MIPLSQPLQELGLSHRESVCYLGLIELGSSKVGTIIKKTSIPSSKIYEVLNQLIAKGLASFVIKTNIRWYQPAHPHIVLELAQAQKERIAGIVPFLLQNQSLANQQSVGLFEGQKAVFALFVNLINDAKPKEVYQVFSIDEENKTTQANIFFKNLSARRKEKKLTVKILKHQSFKTKLKFKIKTNLPCPPKTPTFSKLRFTPFNLPQGITIFRDTVILLSWIDSPVAIKIQSDIFAFPLKNFFNDLWKMAKT